MRVLVFGILLSAIGIAAELPPLLEGALKRTTGLAILKPEIDLRDALEADQVRELHKFGIDPWLQGDVDHDGVLDVAAVVTARGAHGRRFGVLAVLSTQPERTFWIIQLRDAPLYGISFVKGIGDQQPSLLRDRIEPASCFACDANSWVRWSGRAFEWELYSEDDVLAIADQKIFEMPNENARSVARSGSCARIRVLDFRGQDPNTRWYWIETMETKSKKGWIPASAIIQTFGPKLCEY
jgi:hypothetical protein